MEQREVEFKPLYIVMSIADCNSVTPHAAFQDPNTPPTARMRESIECIALVVYPELAETNNNTNEEEV